MIILFLLCSSMLFLFPASAHSGDTDSSGGHYNHSTGEYHYHHGYPAHQHIDGVCPYMSYTSSGSSNGTGNKYVDAVFAQMAADEEAWHEENKYYLEMDHEELVKEYLSMKQSFETVKAQRDALYEDANYEDSCFSIGLAIGIALFMVSLILAARNIHLKKQLIALREAPTK